MADTLYIVMPAYNEEDNIKNVIEAWYPLLAGKNEQSRLVVADFGSKDNTHNVLLELKNTSYPQLEILNNNNQFHGPKVLDLYKYAINHGADYVFQTDSDGQTNPAEFDAFWQAREKYNGIFGNRTVRGDGNYRAFVEKVVCLLVKLFFGVNVPDANAPFRLMKCDSLKKYISKLPADYNIPNIMLTTYFVRYKEPYSFREISFKPRQGGENSINIPKIVKIGFNALKDFMNFRKDMRNNA